jgi:hypothetical protein
MGKCGRMWNEKCGMKNELAGNTEGEVPRNEECGMRNELNRHAEKRVLSLVPNNSELRTYNSELGAAVDLQLRTRERKVVLINSGRAIPSRWPPPLQ